MAKGAPASNREDGFTLIELLVSLTILAMVLGLLGGAMRILSKNWDANTAGIEALDMTSRAFDIFQRDASGLLRLTTKDQRSPRFIFTGTQDTLSFVTLEPPYPSAAGPYFVQYSLAPNGTNVELIRARAAYQTNMQVFPGATPANRVKLLQGPFQYQFAYARKTARGLVWSKTWLDPVRLPDFFRLEVVNARNSVPIAPSFVVAVPASAEIGCVSESPKLCSATSQGELKRDENNKTPPPEPDKS